MHSIWHIPELVLRITTFLDERDLARCYRISQQWRNILKANIPPHRLPLPDVPNSNNVVERRSTPILVLPQDIRDYAIKIKEHNNEQKSVQLGSTSFAWRDSTHWNLLEMVRPYLHPWIGKHATLLCDNGLGFRWLVEGRLDIRVQTSCTFKEFEALVDGETESQGSSLTQMRPSSVDIFCVEGAEWDTTYDLGQHWDRRYKIRVERRLEVRMIHVIDEMRERLLVEPDKYENERVLLQWRFNEPSWALNQNLVYMAQML